ncbi:periplasmic chaperone for outer membrane proteins Skp [Thioclava sp. ES.031]|uniref:OmpH family outer membrane protein n=1 Tax=Thioclava sp. ES.031 TaxID=1798203 RepID=UPI000BF76961|nr:OmpH family outer membrane protein [Thioclava sp. ES.031]PFG63413.1 periplasmic chaperone for outer membrane proteins Skp [Thioclava sp. ES.031]
MRLSRFTVSFIAAALAFGPGAAVAQSAGQAGDAQVPAPGPRVQSSAVLTLDWEKLYDNSLWGKRVQSEIQAASSALRKENDRIASQLEAEERKLTEERLTMPSDEFQQAADAFDKRATDIRKAQKAKADAIQSQLNQEHQTFVQTVVPLLDEVLKARGAVVVLDSRAIIRGLAQADVTQELGARVDKEIGDGAGRVTPLVPPTSNDGSGNASTGAGAAPDAPAPPAQTTPAQPAPDQAGNDATTDQSGEAGVFVDTTPNTAPKGDGNSTLDGATRDAPGLPLGLPVVNGTQGTQSDATTAQ